MPSVLLIINCRFALILILKYNVPCFPQILTSVETAPTSADTTRFVRTPGGAITVPAPGATALRVWVCPASVCKFTYYNPHKWCVTWLLCCCILSICIPRSHFLPTCIILYHSLMSTHSLLAIPHCFINKCPRCHDWKLEMRNQFTHPKALGRVMTRPVSLLSQEDQHFLFILFFNFCLYSSSYHLLPLSLHFCLGTFPFSAVLCSSIYGMRNIRLTQVLNNSSSQNMCIWPAWLTTDWLRSWV